MFSAKAITFDVDWAPDWTVLLCARICADRGVPATFFVTHETPILDELRRMDGMELGLHPNFLPRSSHGETPEAVIDHCVSMVPEARSFRTHGLVQSTPLLRMISGRTQLDTDVSLYLPGHEGLQPVDYPLGDGYRGITRLPYFWEDDQSAFNPDWHWEMPHSTIPGLAIFDFHPIHVALNTSKLEGYDALKASLGKTHLREATEEQCVPFVGQGAGARTFLERILDESDPKSFMTVSDITRRHLEGKAK